MKLVSNDCIKVRINDISRLVLSKISDGSVGRLVFCCRMRLGAYTIAMLLSSIFVCSTFCLAQNTKKKKQIKLIINLFFFLNN